MLALFDLDNTLLDRRAVFVRWAEGLVQRWGIDDPGAVEWLIEADADGFGDKDRWFPEAVARFGRGWTVSKLEDDRRSWFVAGIEPDLRLLDRLAHLAGMGWTVGIVTNGPVGQRDKIIAARLHEVAEVVVISAEAGVRKPDPRIFEEAARRAGRPLEGWMVGDQVLADVAGGRAAGLETVWIAPPGFDVSSWPNGQLGPTAVVADIHTAIDVLIESSGSGAAV